MAMRALIDKAVKEVSKNHKNLIVRVEAGTVAATVKFVVRSNYVTLEETLSYAEIYQRSYPIDYVKEVLEELCRKADKR